MTSNLENSSPPVELETGPNPVASVIWLHGLGADGHDFESIIPELNLPATLPLRFIFPHAPFRPVTINGGQVTRAWYDMSFSRNGIEGNAEHMPEAEAVVHALIDQEIQRGVAPDRILLAGFSQGGAVALYTALRYEARLAGVLALSTYIPFPEALPDISTAIPIFMAHGTEDQVIPLGLAETGHELLVSRGLPVKWQTYPMPHAVCEQEIQDVSRWLQELFLSK